MPSRHRREHTPGQPKLIAALVVAMIVIAAALGGSLVYGLKHRQRAAEAAEKQRPAVRQTISASFSVGQSGVGGTAELGGIKLTVNGIECGRKISASIRKEWSQADSGLPCIVHLSGTTGTAPVNLLSDAQNLSDDEGHVYQVSPVQHVITCDKLYDRMLPVRTTVDSGCLLFTLSSHRKPSTLTLIHGPHSALVRFVGF